MWFPLLLLVLAVLFQKLPTREERFPATGDDEVVWFPLSEEANGAFRRQRPPNTVPLDGAFGVVAHGTLNGLWHGETPAESRALAVCPPSRGDRWKDWWRAQSTRRFLAQGFQNLT